jgi:hypothetical protein
MKSKNAVMLAILVVNGFGTTSCSKNNHSNVQNKLLSHDFVVSTVSTKESSHIAKTNFTDDQDCLEHIKSITCFTDNQESGFDLNCTSREIPAEIVSKISDLIENLPVFHQKVFCHINRLQLHTKISSIAYAATIQNDHGESLGNMIGLRLDAIRSGTQIDLFSWKEQLNFGLSKHDDPSYATAIQGPHISLAIGEINSPLLFDVVVHEISHLIDFMNMANNQSCAYNDENNKKLVTCKPMESAFNKISWPVEYSFMNDGSDWPPTEFKTLYPWLSQFCYYHCVKYISPDDIKTVYNELSNTKFVSAYSSSNMWEDFAETSTAFVLKPRGFHYKVVDGNNEVLFDLDQNWEAENLKAKRIWLNDFYSRNDLKYQFTPSSNM